MPFYILCRVRLPVTCDEIPLEAARSLPSDPRDAKFAALDSELSAAAAGDTGLVATSAATAEVRMVL